MSESRYHIDDSQDAAGSDSCDNSREAKSPASAVTPRGRGRTSKEFDVDSMPPSAPDAQPPTPYYSDEFVTLYHGDCREIAAWLKADVLVTDPPYGIPGGRISYERPAAEWDILAVRDEVVTSWGAERPALVFGTWKSPRPPGTRQVLIWDKSEGNGPGTSRWSPWGASHEEVYVLGMWPALIPGGRAREGGAPARSSGVLRVPNYNTQASDRPDHPTPKPVALMERLIAKCPPGIIADPFAGSGSTLIAAKHLGRKAIGVELDERYCEIAARRLSQDVLNFAVATSPLDANFGGAA